MIKKCDKCKREFPIEKMKEYADFTGHALELVQKVNEVIEELNELKKAKTD